MSSVGRRFFRLVAAAPLAILAACSNGPDLNPASLVSGGSDPQAVAESAARFTSARTCPTVAVRDGTQVFTIYERGRDQDPKGIRFQANIGQMARECTDVGDSTIVKVGVAGRLINGPTGATGNVDLPLRVVLLRNGAEVVYSQLFRVPASLAAGQGNVLWTHVADGIQIPADKRSGTLQIYVGFDEGPAGS
ncbi:hypothetical protein [Methylobrevis albus]|uniref:Lipoprotein n=1 Tax=Methylobrevis albus TaxID=2793297 RepID=A0A931MWJ2_9HYPH|nr:hypothetical protein [Methylobrevis albus]MBH0237143.1 hypothetical protein [Methylobrevis albus]